MAEDRILDKIQALLDRANHPDANEHERDACIRKADAMMKGHQIEEAALRARNFIKGQTEEKRFQPTDIRMDWVSEYDEFYPAHRDIMSGIRTLTGVRIVLIGFGKLHVIGMPDDIEYFRMMWLSAHLTFSARLFPNWNTNASAGENIRTFVEAGYKWNYIWDAAVKNGQPFMRKVKGAKDGSTEPVPAPPGDGGWMKRALGKAYEATGEERPKLEHGVKNYRNSYALGFVEVFMDRVWAMHAERHRMEAQSSSGAQMVLASDVTALDDYYRKLYPPGTLGTAGRGRGLQGNHAAAAAAGRTAAQSVDMSGGRGGVGGRGPAGALPS